MIEELSTEEITDKDLDDLLDENNAKKLVLWNDDYNTFDHVIATLVKHLGFGTGQAEQCAILVDKKGKCNLKSGTHEELKGFKDILIDAGLNATIE